MGYTHYWFGRPEVLENYESLATDVERIEQYCDSVGVKLYGYDPNECEYVEGAPLYTDNYIAFNGVGDEGHEPFFMLRVSDDQEFPFCKTAAKPYDIAVCLMLLRMQVLVPSFTFDSDGDLDSEPEWVAAKKAYAQLFTS